MSLQPISSQLQFEIATSLLTRFVSTRVGLSEQLSPQQILERAVMQALNSTDVGMAQAFLRQSGLQFTEPPARQQFEDHAVYSFTPPPNFWPHASAFRQGDNGASNGVNGVGQTSTTVTTANQSRRIHNLFALLKAKWSQALSRSTANGTRVNSRISTRELTTDGQPQFATVNARPRVASQPLTQQTASATQVQLTPQTLLAMSPQQLKGQPEAAKKQVLVSLGVSEKDLKKLKGNELDKALTQLAEASRTPGKHKVTLKLDKKYELKTQIGADGRIESFGLKKKKGFFGKLWDGVKTIAPIAGYVLAPFTGGLSLVASAAIGAVDAVKNKNWLGAITSAAGAFVPGAGNIAGKAIGQIAGTVQKVAFTAQGVFAAVEGRNPLSLVGTVAGGFANIAGGIGNVSGRVLETTQRVQRWANLALRGQSIIKAASSGDFFGAATGALGTAAGLTKDANLKSELAKYAGWADQANTVQWAIRTKNYALAANSALSLAGDVRQQANVKVNGRDWLGDALRLTETGARLQGALRSKNPFLMSQAVLSLGDTLDTFRRDSREAGGVKGELGAGLYRTANILRFADTTIRAVREGRTSDAAAFGLGLAAELSGNDHLKQAADVGQSAAVLMRAIRSKNVMMIELAGDNLLREVGLGQYSVKRYRDQLLTKAREQLEALENNGLFKKARDLASRIGLTPPFVSPTIATPPFVASSSAGQTLDTPPVLGPQLFEPQLVTTPTVSPLFSTAPSFTFVPARFVVEDVESEAPSTSETGLLAEFSQRRQQSVSQPTFPVPKIVELKTISGEDPSELHRRFLLQAASEAGLDGTTQQQKFVGWYANWRLAYPSKEADPSPADDLSVKPVDIKDGVLSYALTTDQREMLRSLQREYRAEGGRLHSGAGYESAGSAGDAEARKMEQLLRDARIVPSLFGTPSKLSDLKHIAVAVPADGKEVTPDRALVNYIEQRYGSGNLWGPDFHDILSLAKLRGVKAENLSVHTADGNRIAEFDLSVENLLKVHHTYLGVQEKVNADEALFERVAEQNELNRFLRGAFNGAWGTLKSNWEMITDPIGTLRGIKDALVEISNLSLDELRTIVVNGVKGGADWVKNASSPEIAEKAGELVGAAVVEIALGKGAGALLKALRGTRALTAVVQRTEQTLQAAKQTIGKLPIPTAGTGIIETTTGERLLFPRGELTKLEDLLKPMESRAEQAEQLSTRQRRLFDQPTTQGDPGMPAGTGETDKYGNVKYSTAGSAKDQALARSHEKVHQLLSPKLKLLREFRADIAMTAYQKSSLCRYLEEALAESYAQLKVNGIKGLPDGIRFPVTNGYVELKDVIKEGAIGTVTVGGITYGVYLVSSAVSGRNDDK